MNRFLASILLAVSLSTTMVGQAQSPATTLDRLGVEIWPDYDRPSVLVLLTGTLPDDGPMPALVKLPIPPDATLNAVARISSEGDMLSDITYDDSTPGELTLTATDPHFRVEYYVPYTTDGDRHSLTFDWQSDLTINELVSSVQQPALATEMTVSPAAAGLTARPDGLRYHDFSPRSVMPGETYSLEASYALVGPQLSAEVLAAQEPTASGQAAAAPDPAASLDSGFNWPLVVAVAGGLLIVAGAVWVVASNRRTKRRPTKPRPVRRRAPQKTPRPTTRSTNGTHSGDAKYCHECGQPVESGDRFCRNCGTATKGT